MTYEVGSEEYYNAKCEHPLVPDPEETESGVTIGIGYDLGQVKAADFRADWEAYLPAVDLAALQLCCGAKGEAAARRLPQARRSAGGGIAVPWAQALKQFLERTVPKEWRAAREAFPGVENAPKCVQEALLCLVFNRGPGMEGASRVEMRVIRTKVEHGLWSAIPEELRAMKRLWPEVKQLRERREAEAKYIEEGLAARG